MMNKIKHITDWPAAGSSVDWKGLKESSNQFNNKDCISCNPQNKSSGFITSQKRGGFFQISGANTIETSDFESDGRAYKKYQLLYEDIFGDMVPLPQNALPRCNISWSLQGGGNATAFISRDRVSSSNPNLNWEPIDFGNPHFLNNSNNNGDQITSIWLFAEGGIRRNVTIDVQITNCSDSADGGSARTNVDILPFYTSNNNNDIDPEWACTIRGLLGPEIIECGKSGIYEIEYPSQNGIYTFEVSWPDYWKINQVPNSNSIELVPPSLYDLVRKPQLQNVFLCVNMSSTNSNCAPSSFCKLVRAECRVEQYDGGRQFDPTIINGGYGTVKVFDWPNNPNWNPNTVRGIRQTDKIW